MPRRRHDVPHEAVTFNAEAERGPVGQAHDAHGRCDIRQCKRQEMSDTQRRRHGQKVPELVPGTFLNLHGSALIKAKEGGIEEERVNLQPCRSVRLHNFADVASKLGERGADMAMFYDKGLGNVGRGGRRRLYSLQMSAIFASASHSKVKQQNRAGRGGGRSVKIHWIYRITGRVTKTSSCYLINEKEVKHVWATLGRRMHKVLQPSVGYVGEKKN